MGSRGTQGIWVQGPPEAGAGVVMAEEPVGAGC